MKFFCAIFLLMGSFVFAGEETVQASQNQGGSAKGCQRQNQANQAPQDQDDNSMNNQGSGMNGTSRQEQANCSRLTMDERHFSMQLSPVNKILFCNKFTSDQRTIAMEMVGEEGEDGSLMNEDDAVLQVAEDNKMVMPTPMPGQPATPGSSCSPK